MKFVLHILASPYSVSAQSPIRFAQAALRQNHQITGIFFSAEAVQLAHPLAEPLPEEYPLAETWLVLAEQNQIPLWICVTAGVRRGIVEPAVRKGFIIAGLGQLITATVEGDRLLTFN